MKKNSSTEHIYRQIRAGIMDGAWLPGERLVTSRLAAQFNVSRTPIREALKKLENDALVSIELNVGAVIRKVDINEIIDIYDLRAAVESLAVEKAVEHGTSPAFIKRLRDLCEQRRKARSFEEFEFSDREFHLEICRASKSRALLEIIQNHMILSSAFSATPRIMKIRDLDHGLKHEEHEKIIDAIEEADAVKAARLMKEHILNAKNVLVDRYFSRQQEASVPVPVNL